MNVFITSIILFVQDVDKLKSFYTNCLGLSIQEEIGGEWVLLGQGVCKIALHKVGPAHIVAVGNKPSADSNTKIVFETMEDIFTVREDLLSKQVNIKDVKTFEGYDYWLCDGEDPEGNVFQIKQQKVI